jgi:MATE family multidrug resistance protein
MPSAHHFSPAAFFRMAMPMIISRAGLAAMGIADGVMVSRFDARSFAFLSLAEGTLGRFLDVCIAFLIGGLSLVPRHFARGDFHGARSFWHRTIPVAALLGIVGSIVGLFGSALLHLIGQKPELIGGAAPVMFILGLGYPAALLAISAAVYLEGVNRPVFVAVSVVTANLLNIAFNWIFIGGHFGCPAMGAQGSALSTTLVRCGLAVALVICAWRSRAGEKHTEHELHLTERKSSKRAQWRLGFSTAGTVAVMVVLTSSLTIFAGWLGILPLAIFAGTWSLAAPVALVALGMSDATGIFVAAEAGRQGDAAAARVAYSSLSIAVGVIGTIAAALALLAGQCAQLYTKSPQMQAGMTSVIPVAGAILVVDCICFVMASSLRAIKDAAWPAGLEVGSMLLLVPIAAELALVRGMGARGLFLAMLASGVCRAVMLAARFWYRTRSSLTGSSPTGLAEPLKGQTLNVQ